MWGAQGGEQTWDPTVALCLGICGDPRGVSASYERGTPVWIACNAGDLVLGQEGVDAGLLHEVAELAERHDAGWGCRG